MYKMYQDCVIACAGKYYGNILEPMQAWPDRHCKFP